MVLKMKVVLDAEPVRVRAMPSWGPALPLKIFVVVAFLVLHVNLYSSRIGICALSMATKLGMQLINVGM